MFWPCVFKNPALVFTPSQFDPMSVFTSVWKDNEP